MDASHKDRTFNQETGDQHHSFVTFFSDVCHVFSLLVRLFPYIFYLDYILILGMFFLNLSKWFCCLNLTVDVTVVLWRGVQMTRRKSLKCVLMTCGMSL